MSKEKTFGSKLKDLFLGPRARPIQKCVHQNELIITAGHIQDISPSSPANNRERRILELTQLVEKHRLEPTAPDALTNAIKDLLLVSDQHKRRLALNFIHAIIRGQDEELGMLRDYYFHLISDHRYRDDQPILLDILNTLTKGGHNLAYIDQQIGDLLVQWLNEYTVSENKKDFLVLLVNVIKYNSAFIDEDNAMELFKVSCAVCNKTTSEDEILLCLLVLENIIKYYYLKSAALLPLCMTLSRTVLTETFVQSSWKLMKELLGTHLGYSALATLICILQNRSNKNDGSLLRGAVFFIGMALWGSQRVETLQVSATAVLPAFNVAVSSRNTRVAYEISLTVLRLVRKFGKSQPSILWENVLDILDSLYDLVKCGSVAEAQIMDKISNNLHDILTAMEDLQDSCTYSSSPDRLFSFIEMCAASRPEASVTMLLEHRSLTCRPNQDNWLANLESLLAKYYKTESRPAIKLKALSTFNQIIITNKILYEEELLELLLTTCSAVYADNEVTVRCQVVKLLVEQAKSCTSRKCEQIILLLRKIVDRDTKPNLTTSSRSPDTEHKCADIQEAMAGLVDIFKIKLYEPRGSQAVLPLEVIVDHMKSHYTLYQTSPSTSHIRKLVLSLFLDIRVDWSGKVGLEGQGYSSYVYISNSYIRDRQAGEVTSVDVKVLNFADIMIIINTCLVKEVDWSVLSSVLKMMPKQWQNKTLILSTGNYVDLVCQTLCSILRLKEKDLRKMFNTPTRFNKSDFDEQIFPLLTCMSAYHTCLYVAKGDLIKCLEFGLLTKCARICVHTLRVCCLEMDSIMMKMLPGILNTISRIRANKTMALPLLMFLSCLVRLPKLYRNFNEDQYRFIFGIALPYTDPSQFQHFAVYLAYHVIVMWFVRCRLRYRKQFVQLIIKSLHTHAKNIRESQMPTHPDHPLKEGMSENEKMLMFHQELQETCIDIMCRYTFSNCATVPKRTPVTNFLLEGGRSQSWFVGYKLITITTSGGGSKVTKTGLCQRCTQSVRGNSHTPVTTPTEMTHNTSSKKRQRHRSAYVGTRSDPVTTPQFFTQDDMIHNKQDVISENGPSPSPSTVNTPDCADELFNAIAQQKSGGQFNLGACNCWCNGWAEIYIHRPSGDTSWILRIQNKQLFNYEEFPLSDISSLFMPSPHKSPFPSSTAANMDGHANKMIESKSMEENEFYEEEREKHFNGIIGNSTAKRRLSLLQYTDVEEDSTMIPPTAIHRTLSSPIRNHSSPEIGRSGAIDIVTHAATSGATGGVTSGATDGVTSGAAGGVTSGTAGDVTSGATGGVTSGATDGVTSGATGDVTSGAAGCVTSGAAGGVTIGAAGDVTSGATGGVTIGAAGGVTSGAAGDVTSGATGDVTSGATGGVTSGAAGDVTSGAKDDVTTIGSSSQIKARSPLIGSHSTSSVPSQQIGSKVSAFTRQRSLVHLAEDEDDTDSGLTFTQNVKFSETIHQHLIDESDSPADSFETAEITPCLKPRSQTFSYSIKSASPETIPVSSRRLNTPTAKDMRAGILPNFVFLQLYHMGLLHITGVPVPVPDCNEEFNRGLKNLERMAPYETHKVGVVYVDKGQAKDETAILANTYGSQRYAQFLKRLGTLLTLSKCDPRDMYVGGLDHEQGTDGKYTYTWHDEVVQMVFHIATMMPSRESDVRCNNKKMHIGNDYVTIVYNDSGEPYTMGTIKGQFNYVNIVIEPLDQVSNAVSVMCKDEIKPILEHVSTRVIGDEHVADLVKQIALHSSMASLICERLKNNVFYASNWLERLRQLKRMRDKVPLNRRLAEKLSQKANEKSGKDSHGSSDSDVWVTDFTEYV